MKKELSIKKGGVKEGDVGGDGGKGRKRGKVKKGEPIREK